jgi:hypothetical protein
MRKPMTMDAPYLTLDAPYLTLRAALAANRLDDFVRQEEARGVELCSGSDFERALALFLVQRGLRRADLRLSETNDDFGSSISRFNAVSKCSPPNQDGLVRGIRTSSCAKSERKRISAKGEE